ncbi:unnamed protein product [Phytophthora fragariaefolia]|uniref:Unnamed protein product n=1 Tax=Phytophthora fragariaefolia TaxID=1490495 RepID=A0A9W6XPM0_9STRA|nr:unnamed protein product [Phytophthora fragariaefolia]
MTPHRNDLFEYKDLESKVEVTIADGKKIRMMGTGSVRLTGIDGWRIKMIVVLSIPELDRHLQSVSRLAERGMSLEFQKKSCTIWNMSKTIASGKKVGKAYALVCEMVMTYYVEYAGVDSEWELGYASMGYLNKDTLVKTLRATTGIPTLEQKSMRLCGGCTKGKQTVAHFPSRSMSKTKKVFTDLSMMPYELVFKDKPRLGHLSGFGLVGYAHIDKAKRTKLDPKNFKWMFLGYAENSKGYRVYGLESYKVKVIRSMTLDVREVDGIYDSAPTESTAVIHLTEDVDEVVLLEQEQQPAAHAPMGPEEWNHEEKAAMPEAESDASMRHGLATYRTRPREDFTNNLVFHPEPELVRRPRYLVLALEDKYKVNDEEDPNNDDHFWLPSPKRPRVYEDGLLAEAVLAYAASVGDADDAPTTYEQVMKSSESSEWIKAMNSELTAHADNGPRAIQGPDGGEGLQAEVRCGLLETCLPVANMNSIRVVLSVVVTKAYVTEHLDADTAFLNSDLKEQGFMEVPHGVTNAENMMCKLDKPIYGLKQAASAWHQTIHPVLMKIGIRSCGADQCAYVNGAKGSYMYVRLYVDDMIIAAQTNKEMGEVKLALKSAFKMIELGGQSDQTTGREGGGEPVRVRHDVDEDTVANNKCGARGHEDQAVHVAGRVLVVHHDLHAPERGVHRHAAIAVLGEPPAATPEGRHTRSLLPEDHEGPRDRLQRIRHKVVLEAYTDADWGTNLDDRRSVSGIMIMTGNAPVVFKSKYQRTVALSSAEAEYMALSLYTQKVLWTRAMFKDSVMSKWERRKYGRTTKASLPWHATPITMRGPSMSTLGTTSSARTWMRAEEECADVQDEEHVRHVGSTGHVRHVPHQDPIGGYNQTKSIMTWKVNTVMRCTRKNRKQ